MPDQAVKAAYELHERRIRDAVALKTPDRVPVLPNGPAWPARYLGVPLTEVSTMPELAYRRIVEAYAATGDIDGIQSPAFDVSTLSIQWLSRVKVPGRDLPDTELWQVDEAQIMTAEDYDAIVDEGYAAWSERYYRERLPGTLEAFGRFADTIPDAIALCEEKGLVPLSPAVATIPYEYFCGGRSMREFLIDLFRNADRLQAAMDAALPVLVQQMRDVIRRFDLMGLWIGGWRSASQFVSPQFWDRFVFPYYKVMVDAAIEEGAIPVLHFDANWDRDVERLLELPKGRCVLSLDGRTDIFRAKEILRGHMCIMGDVPASLFSLSTPEKVGAYCRRLVNEVGPDGFILTSGCDVPIDAKPENVRAMVEAVQ